MVLYPTWGVLALTSVLFAASVFLINWDATRDNVGWLLAWPSRLATRLFGEAAELGTLKGALGHAGYHALNFVFLYLCAVAILRQRRDGKRESSAE
jgi:hypothetical protein